MKVNVYSWMDFSWHDGTFYLQLKLLHLMSFLNLETIERCHFFVIRICRNILRKLVDHPKTCNPFVSYKTRMYLLCGYKRVSNKHAGWKIPPNLWNFWDLKEFKTRLKNFWWQKQIIITKIMMFPSNGNWSKHNI